MFMRNLSENNKWHVLAVICQIVHSRGIVVQNQWKWAIEAATTQLSVSIVLIAVMIMAYTGNFVCLCNVTVHF